MISYTGKRCFSCGKVFDDNDDIVVCPDCGTPYHRECYKKTGCTNEELHKTHGSWQAEENEKGGITPKCPNCGNVLRDGAVYCDRCGHSVTSSMNRPVIVSENLPGQNVFSGSSDFVNAMNPNPSDVIEDNVTMGDLSNFVGTNRQYYIPRFSMMHKLNMKISFNIGAFFFPEAYFAYRRMLLPALLVYLLRFVILLPVTAQTLTSMLSVDQYYDMFKVMLADFPSLLPALDVYAAIGKGSNTSSSVDMLFGLSTLSSFMNMAVEMAMCLFANSIYYRFCINSVKSLKVSDKGDLIADYGGTSILGMVVFLILSVVRIYASIFILLSIIS